MCCLITASCELWSCLGLHTIMDVYFSLFCCRVGICCTSRRSYHAHNWTWNGMLALLWIWLLGWECTGPNNVTIDHRVPSKCPLQSKPSAPLPNFGPKSCIGVKSCPMYLAQESPAPSKHPISIFSSKSCKRPWVFTRDFMVHVLVYMCSTTYTILWLLTC